MKGYIVFDNWNSTILKTFPKKEDCRKWLMEGLLSTDGAESDHYKNMLYQLLKGKKTLCYWEK